MLRIFVWGNLKKGIAIAKVRDGSWSVYHVHNGKIILQHTDYSSKAEAIREAKSYANYEKSGNKGFFNIGLVGARRSAIPKGNRPPIKGGRKVAKYVFTAKRRAALKKAQKAARKANKRR